MHLYIKKTVSYLGYHLEQSWRENQLMPRDLQSDQCCAARLGSRLQRMSRLKQRPGGQFSLSVNQDKSCASIPISLFENIAWVNKSANH